MRVMGNEENEKKGHFLSIMVLVVDVNVCSRLADIVIMASNVITAYNVIKPIM